MSDFDVPIYSKFHTLRRGRYELSHVGGGCFAYLTKLSPPHSPENSFLIATLFTEPGLRGQGLGRRLMNELIEAADNTGAELVLKPASFDERALSDDQLILFYATLGFEPLLEAQDQGYLHRVPAHSTGSQSRQVSLTAA